MNNGVAQAVRPDCGPKYSGSPNAICDVFLTRLHNDNSGKLLQTSLLYATHPTQRDAEKLNHRGEISTVQSSVELLGPLPMSRLLRVDTDITLRQRTREKRTLSAEDNKIAAALTTR